MCSAPQDRKQLFEAMGDELHSHGGHDQPHDPGDDVDPGLAQQPGDGRGQAKQQHRQAGKQHDGAEQGDIVGDGGMALGVEDDRADRPRSGQERGAERHHGDAVTLGRVEGLLLCLLDVAHLGIEHRDRHQQDQDPAADPERTDGYPEEAEDGLAGEQDDDQNGPHRHRGEEAVGIAGCRILIGGHVDEDRDGADRVDDRQQGDEKFEVFVEISAFHIEPFQIEYPAIVSTFLPVSWPLTLSSRPSRLVIAAFHLDISTFHPVIANSRLVIAAFHLVISTCPRCHLDQRERSQTGRGEGSGQRK